MRRIWLWLFTHAVRTILLLSLVTGFLLWQFRHLQFDTSSSTLIFAGSPEHQYFEKAKKIFGSDQVILVGLTGEDMLQPAQLQTLRDLTRELETIPGVKRVISLANTMDVKGNADEVVVSPLIPQDLNLVDRSALQARLRTNPFYEKNLISQDGRTSSVVVFLEDSEDKNAISHDREVARKVRSVSEAFCGKNELFIGGLPEMELQGTTNMVKDLGLFTPITLGLVVVTLLITFRCVRGILVPLTVIGVTLIWTIGSMILSGRPMKVTTLILPSLLIANGCSYVIHFLAQYYHALLRTYSGNQVGPDEDRLSKSRYQESMLEALSVVHRPICISAATTMAGFGALALNRIPAIRDLGIFATLGILLSYLLCMILVPCILVLLRVPCLHQLPGREGSHQHTFLEKLGHFNVLYRKWIWAGSLACAAWALWGVFRVEVETDYLGYFRQSAPIVKASHLFQERLTGIAPFAVIVEATGDRTVIEPEILRAVERLQDSIGKAPGVDLTASFVDVLKTLNRAFHSEDQSFYQLPTEPEVINDLVDFTESDPSRLTEDFLSSDRKFLRILVRTRLFSSTGLGNIFDQLKREAAAQFPPDVKVHATGTLVLMNQTSDQVADEQVKSLVLSVCLIAFIVVLLFRSWKIGLLALAPAALPVFLCFGLMGWSGTPLNVNTSLIANIAIGIAVNNCIHYIVHFRKNLAKGLTAEGATRESLSNAGGPMLASAVALTLAFLVFGFSRFVPVAHFGLLSAFIMGIDLIANVLLLPSLMLSSRPPASSAL